MTDKVVDLATDQAPGAWEESEPDRQLDITRITGRLNGPLGVIAVSTSGLLLLAVFYTLYFGRAFFLPITIAVMLNFLLTPAVSALSRIGLPPPFGAAVILVLFLAVVGYGTYRIWTPGIEWLERAPQSLVEAEEKLQALRKPMEAIQQAGDQVEAIARGDQGSPAGSQEPREAEDEEGLGETILERARAFVTGGSVSIFLLYFLLALDHTFLRKLASVLPNMGQRRKAVLIARSTEKDLSHYVLVRTVTNVGLGVAVGLALWILGMPNPVLWGVMAGVLNYIPYLGGLVGYAVVGVVAFTAFEDTGRALLAPGLYLLLNIIEGNILTPMILGRELRLNPVMIFTWLIFWGWIWGIPGALLAIPLLAMTKIVADNIETLAPLGAFLGR